MGLRSMADWKANRDRVCGPVIMSSWRIYPPVGSPRALLSPVVRWYRGVRNKGPTGYTELLGPPRDGGLSQGCVHHVLALPRIQTPPMAGARASPEVHKLP